MKKNKNAISLLVLLLLVFLTFYYLFRNNELTKLIETIKQINPYYLIAGLLSMFLFIVSGGLGIKVLLDSLRYKYSFFKCLKYSFIGFYFCSITPASGGQPVQIYYMKKDGIEVGDSSLCIMLITVSYQIGLLIICLLATIFKFNFILNNLGVVKYFALFGSFINIILIFLFIAAIFHNKFIESIFSFVVALLSKLRIVKEPKKAMDAIITQIDNYRRGASYIKNNPRVLVLTILLITVQILSRLSVAYAVYKAFGLIGFGYLDILSLQAFLALGIEYLPIPGSVGAAEAGFYAVNSMIFGPERLMSATLLTRGISFYAFLIISGAVSIYAHLKPSVPSAR